MKESFEKPYTEEEALEEASKMKEKIESGEVKGYTEAERQVELERKLVERFGEIKINDELKQQILPYVDSEKLIIGNEDLAAVVTERSERGAGIGYWDQVRVFLGDQNAMQEWNWRHKNDQHLDQKQLSVRNISDIKASKDKDQIIVTLELENNYGNRTVDFEFPADKKLPFKDGEIPTQIIKPTEVYARKEIDEKIEYAHGVGEIQEIAKAGGVELIEDDFRKVISNNLRIGKVEYFKEAQEIAKTGGFELSKDDYKQFVLSCRFSTEWIDADGKYWPYPGNKTCKPIRGIDVVAPLANFSVEDYEEMLEKIIKRSKDFQGSYSDKKSLVTDAEKMAEYGNLDKKAFYDVAKAYLDLWSEDSDKVLEMIKSHDLEFTKEEYGRLTKGFLAQASDYFKNKKKSLEQAQEAAKLGDVKISEDDYNKFLADSIKKMYDSRYSWNDVSKEFKRDYEKAKEITDLAGLSLSEKDFYNKVFFEILEPRYKDGKLHPDDQKTFDALTNFFKLQLEDKEDKSVEQQEKSLPKWLEDVQNQDLEEADKMYSLKPEMRSAESRTGYKPYEKPEITESVVDEIKGYGAFVFKEQIDHDTRFPQMRYTLYFVDKSGNKKEIFEKHDYIDDGGGGSIYVENDPSITEVEISDKKIKFKVGKESHEVAI